MLTAVHGSSVRLLDGELLRRRPDKPGLYDESF